METTINPDNALVRPERVSSVFFQVEAIFNSDWLYYRVSGIPARLEGITIVALKGSDELVYFFSRETRLPLTDNIGRLRQFLDAYFVGSYGQVNLPNSGNVMNEGLILIVYDSPDIPF